MPRKPRHATPPKSRKETADKYITRLFAPVQEIGLDDQKTPQPVAITQDLMGDLQAAYDHFNKALFKNALPRDVVIILQRRANMRGHFGPNRFASRDDTLQRPEIALNPDHFRDRSDEAICSTLGHEMVHFKQHVFDKSSERHYHNKEWAAEMKSIGLQPSSTAPGGKETGQHMSHYIIPGGAFQLAFQQLAATGWKLDWQSAVIPGNDAKRKSKTKFECPSCGQIVRGKPDTAVDCHHCKVLMLPESSTAASVRDGSYDQQRISLVA
jgi:hypothetical protein